MEVCAKNWRLPLLRLPPMRPGFTLAQAHELLNGKAKLLPGEPFDKTKWVTGITQGDLDRQIKFLIEMMGII